MLANFMIWDIFASYEMRSHTDGQFGWDYAANGIACFKNAFEDFKQNGWCDCMYIKQ